MPTLFGPKKISPHSQGGYRGAHRRGKGLKGSSPFSGGFFRGGLKFGGFRTVSKKAAGKDDRFSMWRWR